MSVVAVIRPLPEHRQEVIAAFEQVIARVHAEDAGCELYALHEGDDQLVMIEKWATQEQLSSHGRSPAFAALNARIEGKLIGGLDVQVLRPTPGGQRPPRSAVMPNA